jgi:hypothetical protein
VAAAANCRARTTREGSGGAAGPPRLTGPRAGGGWAAEPAQEGEGGLPRLGRAPGRAARGGGGKGRERKGFPFLIYFLDE